MNQPVNPFVSVLIPCRNEERYIDKVIECILRQDYPTENLEILFLDGMSADRTREIISASLLKYPFMKLIDNAAGVVPNALNEGIRKSKGSLIIRMDAHAIYPDNYISQLVQWQHKLNADNVGGMWITRPGATSVMAKAIAIALSHPFGIGNARYRFGSKEPVEVDTVPYGCYPKYVFDKIGMFDEQLIRNQDDEFNGRLIKKGGKIFLVPDIKIEYFARPDLQKLSKMYYQYGMFKPLVNLKLGYPATMRQLAPLAFVTAIVLSGIISILFPPWSWTFFCVAGFYLFSDLVFSLQLSFKNGVGYFIQLFIIFPVIHFSYGLGYLNGIIQFVFIKVHQQKSIRVSSSR